ncbi:MAG TPA: DnaA regulatory inactivator Hda [Nevskiaceae bacterium]|nr:DnaA regulatory inactivator Hda [Nevskiaceae bacterium]
MKGSQLALGVQLSDTADFGSFFPGPNADALTMLRDYTKSAPGTGVLLFGASATGKTHLLHGLVRDAAARGLAVAYLPLRDLAADGPQILDGLDDRAVVALDDVDAVTPDRMWTHALLRLIDKLRSSHRHLALTTRAAPDRIEGVAADLRTRLAACTVVALKPLSDAERRELLRSRANARGLQIPDDVVRWLLSNLPRDPHTLIAALDRLDQGSLAQKRRLTLPFVQQLLATAGERTAPR